MRAKQRNWLGDEERLYKMVVLQIEYLNATQAFYEAYGITPKEQKAKDYYWYKLVSTMVSSSKYRALKQKYLEEIGMSKEDVREYARSVIKRIVKRNEEDQGDTAVRAVALLAKVSGIDTNEKTDSNITINFTSGKQED